MPIHSRIHIGDTDYARRMNELSARFGALTLQAEQLRRQRGAVCVEEGRLYLDASKVCEDIMTLNLHQRAVHERWLQRREECRRKASDIIDAISPLPPEPAPPEPEPMRETAKEPDREPEAPSAFHTKNAVRDVSAETIQRWHRPQPKTRFDDLVGMEALKQRLRNEAGSLGWSRTDEALHISPVQSYFFYGPAGTGKSTVIEAFASEMMDQGFHYLKLLGSEIHQSLVGVAEKTVSIAFQEAIDNAPCVIFIDEVENVCAARGGANIQGHEKRLTVAFLEAYNLMKQSGQRVIFMGATNHPMQVDGAMLDRVKLIHIPLPDAEVRADFLRRRLDMVELEQGLDFAELAQRTQGYSFRDMESLLDSIAVTLKMRLIRDYTVTDESGEVDREQTDIAVSEAVHSGDIRLTRELFTQCQSQLPPSDKTEIQRELEEFERRVTP